MPQMAPLNWLTLFFLFIMIFKLFNIMNYFSYSNMITSKSLNLKTTKINWKW
uniref:ATP synthase complex subunit 8 n=1 Tax=Disteniazteca fimbriata TaxID=1216934 RepID=U3L0G7_9CUCU|nr:ATP synthase F0 subunit 8 [Disteniazteca fimbriata]